MEEFGTDVPRDDIYSKSVRAGKRTYFFDVKATRSNELYLTITESKRRFNQQTGKFFYEKHKLFLYREDFEKFREALLETYEAIDGLQGEMPQPPESKEDTPGEVQSGTEPSGDTPGEEEANGKEEASSSDAE
ncbi:MAG: DUF3276 family protein [Bacteroidales bacterium]|nr:DUF3276 family protein [Bacteroidales bacterium]